MLPDESVANSQSVHSEHGGVPSVVYEGYCPSHFFHPRRMEAIERDIGFTNDDASSANLENEEIII